MRDLISGHPDTAIAIIDADSAAAMTYAELRDRVSRAAANLKDQIAPGLVCLAPTNTTAAIILYLACLELEFPVALLDPSLSDRWGPLLDAYQPAAVLFPDTLPLPAARRPGAAPPEQGFQLASAAPGSEPYACHRDLALLLTTSGSTGSPKVVRLTRRNVLSNAQSIVRYLGIEPGDRSIQSLPIHYSYGLSLVNSHLLAGATVVLTRHAFWRGEFWKAFDGTQCTSLAGVPFVYEGLHRLRFDARQHPSLRTMTQAGGPLRPDLIRSMDENARAAGGRFFVMYGQTEACARMSYVPWQRLAGKIGSIGVPIPDGAFSLAPVDGTDHQELVYSGPNVMMGYAESGQDLARGDVLGGILRTGDLATVDGDGFYFLAGRLNRFAKLFGRRISLPDIERDLETRFPLEAAAVDRDGQLVVYVAARGAVDLDSIVRHLAVYLDVPPKNIRLNAVADIPLTSSGKKDYKVLSG